MGDASRPTIVWGITGSVAAIRAPQLAERLLSLGVVETVITSRAKHFVRDLPATIACHDDAAEWRAWQTLGDPVLHIELRRRADCLLIAPLTADALAKLSVGICDTLLLSVARAWDFAKPVGVAPAMNTKMWEHPVTAGQLRTLQSWGVTIVEPISKRLACDDIGMGAMAEPERIAEVVRQVLGTHEAPLERE